MESIPQISSSMESDAERKERKRKRKEEKRRLAAEGETEATETAAETTADADRMVIDGDKKNKKSKYEGLTEEEIAEKKAKKKAKKQKKMEEEEKENNNNNMEEEKEVAVVNKKNKSGKDEARTPSPTPIDNTTNDNNNYTESDDVKKYTETQLLDYLRTNAVETCDPLIPSSLSSSPPPSSSSDNGELSEATYSTNILWRPILQFSHLGTQNVSSLLINYLKSSFPTGTPTLIQSLCWPVLLKGRDCIGIAATGSGKTLGFLLPSFTRLEKEKNNATTTKGKYNRVCEPRMLVLAPTRELALQTAKIAEDVGAIVGIRSVCVYGGVGKHEQKAELLGGNNKNGGGGVDLVIATPGRLLDFINDGVISLSQIKILVLDEADRMLDLGFERDIRNIIKSCPKQRQTVMFSATWPPAIMKIASEFLLSPIRVRIGLNKNLCAAKTITQHVEVIEDRAREPRLMQLLKQLATGKDTKILIFILYKKEAGRMESMLSRAGYRCCSIHGDMNQHQRNENFHKFKSGEIPILIATDVAARGLDIPAVSAVINFTFPLTIEDYVHRIGRTGRGGLSGVSYTFFQPTDRSHAGALGNVLREANMSVPEELLKFGNFTKKKEHGMYGAHFKDLGDQPMKAATKVRFD